MCATCLLPEHHGHVIWNPCCLWQQPTLSLGEPMHQNLWMQHKEAQRKSKLKKCNSPESDEDDDDDDDEDEDDTCFLLFFFFFFFFFFSPPFPSVAITCFSRGFPINPSSSNSSAPLPGPNGCVTFAVAPTILLSCWPSPPPDRSAKDMCRGPLE